MNRSIEETILNLKKYIELDEIYTRYKNRECTELDDFEIFCIKHCEDIETVLGNLEALSNMQMAADKELKKAKQINEEHRKINGELRKKVKELEANLYSANSIIDELIEVNKELEAKIEFKEWGDLDDLKFEEYLEELLQEREEKQ